MNNCKFEILAQNKCGYIGVCKGCQEFNFVFNNLLLTFSKNQLFEFGKWLLNNRNSPDYQFSLPNGKTWVFRSPTENLFIAFNKKELAIIEDLYSQTAILLGARDIVGWEGQNQ